MANTNSQENTDNQVLISYELLCLLKWLMEHDEDSLKHIVSKALSSGLKHEMYKLERGQELPTLEDTQHIIVEFFAMIETLLVDGISEGAMKTAHEKKLMPALSHIDSSICDDSTVRASVEKTAHKLDTCPQAQAQELLFKEILRQWKPRKKKDIN